MNVLVLQSFLAVSSDCIFNFVYPLPWINGPTVFITPTTCVNSLPIFELYDELPDDKHGSNLPLGRDGERLPTVL